MLYNEENNTNKPAALCKIYFLYSTYFKGLLDILIQLPLLSRDVLESG